MSDPHPPMVIVCGPTASGKSALGCRIAEHFTGTLINADSQQIYADLSILSARPGRAECEKVPHVLYGVLAGDEISTAARWREMALAEITRCHNDNRLPVLAGGTGMYLRALTKGLAEIPPIPEHVRAMAREKAADLGREAFYCELQRLDPQMAARLHPNDVQRVIRAYEVMTATGRSLSHWQKEGVAAAGLPKGAAATIVFMPQREALYAACDRRFLKMMKDGALNEVKELMDKGFSPEMPIMKALGVRELSAALRGEISLEEAVQKAQRETRRYAKRQLTWFRHQTANQEDGEEGIKPLVIEGVYAEAHWPQIRDFLDGWRSGF